MKKAVSFIVSFLVLMFSVVLVCAENLPDAKASLVAENTTIKKGETFVLSVNFENADEYQYGIEAFMLSLEFDESAFEFKNISFTVDESDITYNQQNGLLKVLYCFVLLNSKTGFNSSGVFCTVEFDVVDDSKNSYDFSADFDTISVLMYDEQGKIINAKVGFNRPRITVEKQIEFQSVDTQSENQSVVTSQPENQSTHSVLSAVSSKSNDTSNNSKITNHVSSTESVNSISTEIFDVESVDNIQSDYLTDNILLKNDDFEKNNYNIVLIITIILVIIMTVIAIVIIYFKKR